MSMHVKTHTDQIWENCDNREQETLAILNDAFPNDLVRLVDTVWPNEATAAKKIYTDTIFLYDTSSDIVDLQPEIWGWIFGLSEPVVSNHTPSKRLNCFTNRIAGERLELFFELAKRGLVEDNYVSFNCLNHNLRPSVEERRQTFCDYYQELGWTHYQEEFNNWKDRMPLLAASEDLDFMFLDSEVAIVSETYVSDSTVAFSEKTFRALQMPRPWLLNCSPGSVDVLRRYGFDVLDDVVNHYAYDHLYPGRAAAMLDELNNIVFDAKRCEQAALHNYNRLRELKNQWPAKLKQVLTHAEK